VKLIFDKAIWIVALSAAVALSGMSLVFCPTALAGSPTLAPIPTAHAPTEAAKHALELDTDDDGNELLEHWGNPKYSREERLQMTGILGAFSVAGTMTAIRRRRALRKDAPYG
jgi:hypothetical protein